jgi:integrase
VKRHSNGGLRKICPCSRRRWATCPHSWHLNFKARNTKTPDSTLPDGTIVKGKPIKGKAYQFSLDRHLGKHIKLKADAEAEAAKIKEQIRGGTFGAAPTLDQLTLGQLLDTYYKRHVEVERKDSLSNVSYQIGTIKRIEIERPDGRNQPFGEWRVADVTVDALDRFKEVRTARGVAAANRDLSLLRAVFNWAIRKKHIKESPFKLGTETVVTLSEEHPRSRRLHDGEEEALLAVCSPHLRAIVTAAIDTGMRRGEILSLQWEQVLGMKIATVEEPTGTEQQKVTWAPGEATHLFLPRTKTKTKKDRKIPIPPRVRSLL